MAQTKEKLISDVILRVTQANPTDDLALEESQVAHWIQLHLHELIIREINDAKKKGKMIPPIYIKRDVALNMVEETITDVDDFDQRLYVTLTEEVLDLPNDGGIVRVLDYDRNIISRVAVEDLEDLRRLRFAKPSPNNVVFYREGNDYIFIEGFNTADIEFNPLMVSYIPKQDIMALADTDEVLVSDQLVPLLVAAVEEEAKLMLYGSEPDVDNDGTDKKKIQYHNAIQNPTVLPQTQPE